MGRLLNTQPDRNKPIEHANFHAWRKDADGTITTAPQLKQVADVLDHWAESLNIPCISPAGLSADGFGGDFEQLFHYVGFDLLWEIVSYRMCQAGFDVYVGNDFIEVYSTEVA